MRESLWGGVIPAFKVSCHSRGGGNLVKRDSALKMPDQVGHDREVKVKHNESFRNRNSKSFLSRTYEYRDNDTYPKTGITARYESSECRYNKGI